MKKRFLQLIMSLLLVSSSSFASISTKPVDSNATEAAQKLYTFLYDNYGKKTISGIMTGDNGSAGTLAEQPDVLDVLSRDGNVMPALIGFDFLMATGKSQNEGWFQGYTNNAVSMAAELWQKGGIPAFCWHWSDPSKTVQSYRRDSMNANNSPWDLAKCFVDASASTLVWNTSSEYYQYLLDDIDLVSKYMLKMQDQGVALIWRPLHEAAGQWFWWSENGAEQYVALYKLLYDRMVNVNGVHNCIWVWNIERNPSYQNGDWYGPTGLRGPEWYPGDAYVDVIGVDVYNRGSNTSAANFYEKIIEMMGSDKILSLSETDYIPDITNMVNDGAIWSWWMPWDQSWSSMFAKTSNSVWTANMSDDRVITLDDMAGWGTYVEPEVTDPCSAQTDLYREAECGDYSGATTVVNDDFSGGKGICVTDNDGYINVTFSVPADGLYKVIVGASGIYGDKNFDVVVNGSSSNVNQSGSGEFSAGTFKMTAGDQLVSVMSLTGWSWYVIDYVRIELDEEASKPVVLGDLCTPNPTAAAQKLYNFLVENWGKKTISGFMLGDMSGITTSSEITDHQDFQAPYTRSGKYTALAGFDFMNATGQSVNSGNSYYTDYTKVSVSLAKDLWKKGGIPAFTWHWRDPSYETDQFYYYDENSHTDGTTIDFTTAMNSDGSWNASSTLYKNMISDIDKVAEYFLDLQENGVAAIFRPLHEASGKWFWWGTQGGANCAKLYRLIYDEMVNVKGVHNLIWVWNPQSSTDEDWNPGSDYYDVVSIDIYNSAYDYQSNYVTFNNLKELSDKSKLVAYSEGGPVMDVDDCYDNDATWSWWMVWYQSWSGNFADQTSNDQWKKVMEDERTITLDEMPGWTSSTDVREATSEKATVSPTRIDEGFIVEAANANVEVLNVAGSLIYTNYVNGQIYVNSSSWANGTYFVMVNGKATKVIK